MQTQTPTSHLSITQAGLTAAAIAVIGQVGALVPSWQPHVTTAIQVTSAAIAVGFLIANSIHALAHAHALNKSGGGLPSGWEGTVAKLVEGQIANLNLSEPVRQELVKIVGAGLSVAAAPEPPAASPPVVTQPAG